MQDFKKSCIALHHCTPSHAHSITAHPAAQQIACSGAHFSSLGSSHSAHTHPPIFAPSFFFIFSFSIPLDCILLSLLHLSVAIYVSSHTYFPSSLSLLQLRHLRIQTSSRLRSAPSVYPYLVTRHTTSHPQLCETQSSPTLADKPRRRPTYSKTSISLYTCIPSIQIIDIVACCFNHPRLLASKSTCDKDGPLR